MSTAEETPFIVARASYGLLVITKTPSAPESCIVHCQISEWSKSVLMDCRKIWAEIVSLLTERGVKHMFAFLRDENVTRIRDHFIRSFGLRRTKRADGYTIYVKEF